MVGIGTEDIDSQDPDFMEMMIGEDGEIDYFTMPTGVNHYQRMYKPNPAHYGKMKTQNETNESAGGDFIRIDGDGKNAETESLIEEPDFIPDGDGRALGQQTSSINLSPLHAETTMKVEHKDGSKYRYSETDPIYDIYGDVVGHVSEITDEKDIPYQPIYEAEGNDFGQMRAENKVLSKTNLVIAGVIGLGIWKGKQILDTAKSSLKQSAENKKERCSTCNSNGTIRKNHTQVKQSEYSVNQINPVEAEGQNDIHGAEGVTNPRHAPNSQPFGYPSKSLKMW